MKPGRLHFRTRDDFNDRHKDDTMSPVRARYAVTKVANTLFTYGLQKRFERDGVKIVTAAVDPGFVDTGELGLCSVALAASSLSKDVINTSVRTEGIRGPTTNAMHKTMRPLYKLIVSAFYTPPSKGARAQLFACTSSELPARSPQITGNSNADTKSPTLLWIFPTCTIGRCTNAAVCEDDALSEEMWEGSLKLLAELGAKVDDLMT